MVVEFLMGGSTGLLTWLFFRQKARDAIYGGRKE
jgi:hypothetical protein